MNTQPWVRRFLGVLVASILAGTLLSCNEETTQPTLDPPPPPPPSADRPPDPGLSYTVGCVHEGEIPNPVDGGGGTPGIPVLINPGFLPAEEADYLSAEDLVFGVELEDRFYAFPMRIMNYHEIATFSVVEGRYAATWCPLSFSFVLVDNPAWDASSSARVASYITSSGLMDDNLVLIDLETKTNWPQLLLKGKAGVRGGECLEFGRNAVVTTWSFWARLHPETQVLTNQNNVLTNIKPEFYFSNPYEDYWLELVLPPTWPVSHPDNRLPRQTLVMGVHGRDGSEAIRVSSPLIHTVVGSTPVVIFQDQPTQTTYVFENNVEGAERTFEQHAADENGLPRFKDTTDGTVWSVDGIALEGPLAASGHRLAQVPAVQVFWFVWATFFPGTPLQLQ